MLMVTCAVADLNDRFDVTNAPANKVGTAMGDDDRPTSAIAFTRDEVTLLASDPDMERVKENFVLTLHLR